MKEQPVILVVEHNKNDVVLITKAFARTGVKAPIKVVASGEEARDYMRSQALQAGRGHNPAPSLVLLDLGLPGEDGFELLKWLRGQPELKDVRIVVLTGPPYLSKVRRAYQFGANSFLAKPHEISNVDAFTAAIQCPGFWIKGQVHEFGG